MPDFIFIIPSYNNADWCWLNLNSVTRQTRGNWRVVYIDDCSSDNTPDMAEEIAKKNGISDRFKIISNEERMGPAASRYRGYQMADDREICCMLDGDDWLCGEDVLERIEKQYDLGFNATYGSYLTYEDGGMIIRADTSCPSSSSAPRLVLPHGFVAPPPVNRHNFDWRCMHLRTMRAELVKDIPKEDLMIDGEWIQCCSDVAESLHVMEKQETRMAKIIQETYVYNKYNSRKYELSFYRPEMQEYKQKIYRHVTRKKTEP